MAGRIIQKILFAVNRELRFLSLTRFSLTPGWGKYYFSDGIVKSVKSA
jgi:hypothetical protein